ncbi:MAG TPA: type 1 glutamine amidotransferase [Solirubrobacteraceae bacterium]|nr:type 1 glutamine amidotransferase [Solirubrobacteraceae bacterium]
MRALVIQHDDNGPAGHVSEWLAARGGEQDLWLIGHDAREPDPRAYDLVVSLGSEHAAYDDAVPWLGLELALLRHAFDADVPVLGICFGSQLLARALGARAMPAPQPEIGWVAISTREPAFVPPGPWLQWHYDTFTPPPGASVLAKSAAGPQAYTIGRSLAVQFHPEVTPDIVGDWVDGAEERLNGVDVDPGRLLAETRERDPENRVRAWRLLDAFWARVSGLSESRTP